MCCSPRCWRSALSSPSPIRPRLTVRGPQRLSLQSPVQAYIAALRQRRNCVQVPRFRSRPAIGRVWVRDYVSHGQVGLILRSLCDVWKHFPANFMLAIFSVRSQIAVTLGSATPSLRTWPLLQANDFVHPHRTFGCEVEDRSGKATSGPHHRAWHRHLARRNRGACSFTAALALW